MTLEIRGKVQGTPRTEQFRAARKDSVLGGEVGVARTMRRTEDVVHRLQPGHHGCNVDVINDEEWQGYTASHRRLADIHCSDESGDNTAMQPPRYFRAINYDETTGGRGSPPQSSLCSQQESVTSPFWSRAIPLKARFHRQSPPRVERG